MSEPWRFMGLDRSHFSGKLRPALRYKELHHVEIAPDFAEIVRRTGVGWSAPEQPPRGRGATLT